MQRRFAPYHHPGALPYHKQHLRQIYPGPGPMFPSRGYPAAPNSGYPGAPNGGHPGARHPGPSHRGRVPRETAMARQQDLQYTWNQFQNEERQARIPSLLDFLNAPPPTVIETIRLERASPGPAKDFCASWLAKNPSLSRAKKMEAIVVEEDERDEVEDPEEVEVIAEETPEEDVEIIVVEVKTKAPTPKKGAKTPVKNGQTPAKIVQPPIKNEQTPAKNKKTPVKNAKKTFLKSAAKQDQADDSIIVIGEFPPQKSKAMTQSDNNMADSFWSSKPSSSTVTAITSSAATVVQTSIEPPVPGVFSTSPIPVINSSIPQPSLFPTTSSTSSSSFTSIVSQNRPLMKMLDGYSKDCRAGKRLCRHWNKIRIIPQLYGVPKPLTSTFTVCSYNVLCQKTIARTNHLYKHLKHLPHFLEWDHRWKGLQEELPTFNADILGLQEVQADHYFEHFEPFMKKHSYIGVYKQKYGTELKDDGCAIFYRPQKFEPVLYKEVNYFIPNDSLSNREHIAQVLALRCRVTGEIIIVANTHLLFNEERGDVKLAQLMLLFSAINTMRDDIGMLSEFKQSIPPVIVMGDFNMEPNSKIYDFVLKGSLFVEGQPIRPLSGQSTRQNGKLFRAADCYKQNYLNLRNDGILRHPFEFSSAYHHCTPDQPIVVVSDEQRSISTYHTQAGAPDFIFYTKECTCWGVEKLQLLERFELPTLNTLAKVTPWPNKNVPSDHLPIMAKFELTKDSL